MKKPEAYCKVSSKFRRDGYGNMARYIECVCSSEDDDFFDLGKGRFGHRFSFMLQERISGQYDDVNSIMRDSYERICERTPHNPIVEFQINNDRFLCEDSKRLNGNKDIVIYAIMLERHNSIRNEDESILLQASMSELDEYTSERGSRKVKCGIDAYLRQNGYFRNRWYVVRIREVRVTGIDSRDTEKRTTKTIYEDYKDGSFDYWLNDR